MTRLRIVIGALVVVALVAVALAGVLVNPRTIRAASPTTFFPCGPWSNVSSPNPGTYTDQLFGVAATSATDVWAVGWEANQAGSPEYTLTEHWNGTNWSTIASPNANNATYDSLQAVTAISSTDVWAVGYYRDNTTNGALTLAEHWDGTSWSIVPSPNPEPQASFYGVSATAANDAWAVGSSYNPSTNAAYTLTEHWDGTSWSVVPSPTPSSNNALFSVAAISATDVWAVGQYDTLFEHWDGTSWSVVPGAATQAGEHHLQGVAAAGANSVWAVGYQYISNQPDAMLAEHWNGTNWSLMPNYTDGSNSVHLYSVAAIPGTQQAVAVGYEIVGSNTESLVLHWGGSSWSRMPMLAQSTAVNQLAGVAVVPAFSLWAVGSYVPSTSASRHTLGRARRARPNAGIPQERTLVMHEKGSQMAIACPV